MKRKGKLMPFLLAQRAVVTSRRTKNRPDTNFAEKMTGASKSLLESYPCEKFASNSHGLISLRKTPGGGEVYTISNSPNSRRRGSEQLKLFSSRNRDIRVTCRSWVHDHASPPAPIETKGGLELVQVTDPVTSRPVTFPTA